MKEEFPDTEQVQSACPLCPECEVIGHDSCSVAWWEAREQAPLLQHAGEAQQEAEVLLDTRLSTGGAPPQPKASNRTQA